MIVAHYGGYWTKFIIPSPKCLGLSSLSCGSLWQSFGRSAQTRFLSYRAILLRVYICGILCGILSVPSTLLLCFLIRTYVFDIAMRKAA